MRSSGGTVNEQDDTEWACAQCGGPASTEKPHTVGDLCAKPCAKKLRAQLLEIPDLFTHLDVRPGSTSLAYAPGKRRKPSGSPALARLDVILLQDPRTTTSAYYGTWEKDDPDGVWKAGDPKLAREAEDKHDPEGSVPVVFLSYANRLAKEVNLRNADGKPWRATTLTQAVETLTGTWWENVCYTDWITDLYQDTADTWRLLRRTNGIAPPRRLGECQCGAPVYEPDPQRDPVKPGPDTALIRCRQCGHQMNVQALLNIATLAEKRIG